MSHSQIQYVTLMRHYIDSDCWMGDRKGTWPVKIPQQQTMKVHFGKPTWYVEISLTN